MRTETEVIMGDLEETERSYLLIRLKNPGLLDYQIAEAMRTSTASISRTASSARQKLENAMRRAGVWGNGARSERFLHEVRELLAA